MEDSKIIELFFERSEQAIVELSKKYDNVSKKIAFNILKNKQDCEECVNDAYLGVWNTVPPQRPTSLKAYVCKIVRSLSIKRYHSNTAVKRNSVYDVALDELENCFMSTSLVEQEFSAKETAKVIDNFLKKLDKESRVMFIRRYWYADSIEDIAEMFQTGNHNISVRLFRIREKLKKQLAKEGVYL